MILAIDCVFRMLPALSQHRRRLQLLLSREPPPHEAPRVEFLRLLCVRVALVPDVVTNLLPRCCGGGKDGCFGPARCRGGGGESSGATKEAASAELGEVTCELFTADGSATAPRVSL